MISDYITIGESAKAAELLLDAREALGRLPELYTYRPSVALPLADALDVVGRHDDAAHVDRRSLASV